MPTRQYIGARYVPTFYHNTVDDSSLWQNNVIYEPLTWVTRPNHRFYLSKKTVPATIGAPEDNISYWLEVGNFDGGLADLQSQIDEINNVISHINGDISALNTRIGTNETAISALTSTVNQHTSDISRVDGEINGLDTRISTNETNITSLTSKVNQHTTDISNINTDVSGLDTRIDTNETNISTLTSTVGQHTSDIARVDGEIDGLDTRVGTNETNITSLTSTVSQHTSNITDLDSRIDALEGAPAKVFLFDSFGENVTPNISTLVPQYMGLSSDEYLTHVKGGCGFGANTPYNYLTELQGIANDIITKFNNADNVKEIIVQGGTNDAYYNESYEDLVTAVNSFATYVKNHYPNATIKILFTGWTDNSNAVTGLNFINLRKAMDAYMTINSLGGEYYDLHNVLHQHSAFTNDHIHPTVATQKVLARAIENVLKTGTYHIDRKLSVTMTPATGIDMHGNVKFIFHQFDDVITAECDRSDGTNWYFGVTCAASDAAGNINNTKIGTISDWLIGGNGRGSCKLMTSAICGYGGNANGTPLQITFEGGNVYLGIVVGNSTSTTYNVNALPTNVQTFSSYEC